MYDFCKIFFLCLFPFVSYSQTISTFAGNGIVSNSGDEGPATSASINYPCYSVFDKQGNLFLTTGVRASTVRKIDTLGIITTIVGINGTSGDSGDGGSATSAILNNPQGIAVDTIGNIFVADAGNNNVRRIDHITGIITTIAGTGVASYNGDNGPATSAGINGPNGICFDKKGNFYIAEYGSNRIRKVNLAGIITTFAGTGTAGYNGDNGLADTSQIRGAFDVCSDNMDNIYIADEANGRIRKIDTEGIIHTIAGTGTPGYSGDGGLATNAEITPHDISCDKYGNLFTCDIYTNKIREINGSGIIELIAGNGTTGFSGDGGPATLASLNGPHKIAIDSCNNLYFSDLNNYRVRKITYPYCGYLSVSEVTTKTDISIYPNPAYNELTITTTDKINSIIIYNFIGQAVYTQQYNNNTAEINIAALPEGMYMVEVTDGEGRRTVKKIVKQ